jgi:hypothetical protein
MKIMVLYTVKAPFTPEQRKQHMPHEVPATLRHYLDGKIEQFWFREGTGPIFLMNVDSIEEAKASMDTLPLVVAGLASYELMPVKPLLPLGLLIQGQ